MIFGQIFFVQIPIIDDRQRQVFLDPSRKRAEDVAHVTFLDSTGGPAVKVSRVVAHDKRGPRFGGFVGEPRLAALHFVEAFVKRLLKVRRL